MTALLMSYIMIMTYIFKVIKFLKIYKYTIYGKWWEVAKSTTFIEVDTSHRLAPMRMLYMVTVTYIFKVTQFLEICLQYLENGES